MPTVRAPERYDQPRVQEQAIPGVRVDTSAPIEAFGGGRANQALGAVADLSNTAAKYIMHEEKKADDISVADYARQIKEWKLNRLNNEQDGALRQKGQNAFGLPAAVGDEYQKFTSELLGKAPNDRVRASLERFSEDERIDLNDKIQVHVGREREVYADSAFNGFVTVAQQDALANANNPEKLNKNLEEMAGAIATRFQQLGRSAEEGGAKITESMGQVHSSVIMRHLDSDDDLGAKAYLEKYAGQMNESQRDAADKHIKAASMVGEAQRKSDEIFAKTSDLGSALKMVQEMPPGKLRQAAQAQVVQTYDLKEKAEAERSQNLRDGHLKKLEVARGAYELPKSMHGSMKSDDIQNFEARKRQLLSGQEAAPNGPDYYRLRGMAADPAKQNEFKNMYLPAFNTVMPSSELSKLIEHQMDLKKGNGKSDKMLGQFRTENEVINSVLNSHKIDPSPKQGSNDAFLVERLRTRVEQESVRIANETGKAPTNDEIQQIADKFMIQTTTTQDLGWGLSWNTTRPRILLEPGQEGFVRYRDIPGDAVAQIKASKTKRNQAITEDSIAREYNAFLNGQK